MRLVDVIDNLGGVGAGIVRERPGHALERDRELANGVLLEPGQCVRILQETLR